MPTLIQHRRSKTAGSAPSSISDGEFVLNQADGALYTPDASNNVVRTLLGGVADTAAASDSSTKIANTSWVRALVNGLLGSYAPLASPTFTGSPKAPTPSAGDSSTLVATTGFVSSAVSALGTLLRGDAAIANTDAVRGQFRSNLIGAPATISTNGTFVAADVGRRAQFAGAGGITRTLPAISSLPAAMWATDVLTNNSTGIVTIAAAGTDPFEGVAGGSLALLPKQRASVYLDTDGWHVAWVERTPIVSSRVLSAPVTSLDLPLPVGYGAFEYIFSGVQLDTNSVPVGMRFSGDGGATFGAGPNDYAFVETVGAYDTTNNATPTYTGQQSFCELGNPMGSNNDGTIFRGTFVPGGPAQNPMSQHLASYDNQSGWLQIRMYTTKWAQLTRVNAVRVFCGSANMKAGGSFIFRGIA